MNPQTKLGNAMAARRGGSGSGFKGGGGGGKPPKPEKQKFHPLQVLKGLEAGKVLTPQQLARAARALTVLETRPEIHGYKQIAHQLGQERDQQAKGLANLGTRTSGAVSGVYKNIAESAAKSLATQKALGESLTQQSSDIAKQGSESVADMQKATLGEVGSQLQLRGAPGGGEAQQALANAVASQQRQQVENSEAAQRLASSQAAGYGALGAGLAGAAQLQGGSAIGQIGRDVVGRTAESNQKYNSNIQAALGKLAEAKAGYGPKYVKNALALREGENKLKLGQEAVAGNRAKLQAEREQNAESNRLGQQRANASSKSAAASLINAETNRWEAHHPGASSTAAAKQRQKTIGYVKDIRSLIHQAASAAKQAEGEGKKNVQTLPNYISYINDKTGAPPRLVEHVVKHWWHNHQNKEAAKNAAPGF